VVRVLAVDIGTSSVRAQIFEADAQEGEAARREYLGETDSARLAALVREAIDEAVAGQSYDAVGASCFGHSLLALDEGGRPLTPILGWRDTRSADAAEQLARRLDAEAVHQRTGCHVHSSYWPAKLAWLATEQPQVFRAARRFVSFPDYLYAQLLGRDVSASTSLASASGLFELHARAWDRELLATLGVEPEQLPQVSDEAVEGWYPALLDGACSNLGAGCVTRERAALMVGTSMTSGSLYSVGLPAPAGGRPMLSDAMVSANLRMSLFSENLIAPTTPLAAENCQTSPILAAAAIGTVVVALPK